MKRFISLISLLLCLVVGAYANTNVHDFIHEDEEPLDEEEYTPFYFDDTFIDQQLAITQYEEYQFLQQQQNNQAEINKTRKEIEEDTKALKEKQEKYNILFDTISEKIYNLIDKALNKADETLDQ